MSQDSEHSITVGILSLLALSLPAVLIYQIIKLDSKLIPLHIFALIGGLLFEFKRIEKKWSKVILTYVIAVGISLISFLPSKNETDYSFELHVLLWPYIFIVVFVIGVISFYKDVVTSRLTEGITLIQSIAVIYWIIALGYHEEQSLFIYSLLILGCLLAVFSFFHAFTKSSLTKNNRFILSLWSSLVMILLGVDHIFRVFQNGLLENSTTTYEASFIGAQYFLLGISTIYIGQNIAMLLGFLPTKDSFFNSVHREHAKALREYHIKRYSEEQVSPKLALLVTIGISSIFFANHQFQFVNPQLAIWFVFFTVPPISNLIVRLGAKRKLYQ